MNGKWLGGMVVTALILGTGMVMLYKNNSASVATALPKIPAAPTNQQPVITLSADGFSPATLTIKAGTTVTWVNKSVEDATVDSDPHPTHTEHRWLNLGILYKDGTLNLTFDKPPGTYRYHNHFNASQKGTIVVEQ